jgi:3-methylcrotonyl-CoA carboxylase beta subunit
MGEAIDEAKMKEFREKIIERYDREGHPYLTGSLLFHDGIITWSESATSWPGLLSFP